MAECEGNRASLNIGATLQANVIGAFEPTSATATCTAICEILCMTSPAAETNEDPDAAGALRIGPAGRSLEQLTQ